MIIKYGNMLDATGDALVVTTNGFVKNSGRNVMGMGIAYQVLNRLPNIDKMYGDLIKKYGHKVHIINHPNSDIPIVMFPVKPRNKIITSMDQVVGHMVGNLKIGDTAPGWSCTAELSIIEQSAKELMELSNSNDWERIIAPRFGCGAGELTWEQVEPIVEPYLDDRFHVYTFKRT